MSTEEPKPGEADFDFRILRSRRLERGEVVKGMVVSVGSSHVFVDVGGKSEAALELKEVTDDEGKVTVKVGDTIEAFVLSTEPEIVLSHSLARNHLNMEALEDAKDLGIPVEGRVTGVNKGGLEVDLKGARAFCPISQIELGYCENASVHMDKVYEFRVIEFAEGGRKLVVSRRALLEEQRQEAAAEVQAQLHEGAEFEGEVTTLQPYGAFVDIGGVQGMVHISQIGLAHIGHPEEVLKVGQKVRVKVMKVEPDPKHPDRQRIALSMRALMGDPWEQLAATLHEGSEVPGKVVRLQPFGAFVEIAPGVDGLVHISELSDRRVQHPSEVVEVGQTVSATVLKVDVGAKRISLSLRGGGGGGEGTTAGGALGVGSVVDVVVDKVKPFGLLVRIKSAGRGGRGLIPIEETGAGRNANLRRSHPEGTELKAMIITVEPDTGKLRLSLRAVSDQEERAEFSSFVGDAPAPGAAPGSSSRKSLGTLGDLLQKSLGKKK